MSEGPQAPIPSLPSLHLPGSRGFRWLRGTRPSAAACRHRCNGRSSTTLAGAGFVGFDKQTATKVWHVALAATGQPLQDKRSTPP
jgi:hypothetical protein